MDDDTPRSRRHASINFSWPFPPAEFSASQPNLHDSPRQSTHENRPFTADHDHGHDHANTTDYHNLAQKDKKNGGLGHGRPSASYRPSSDYRPFGPPPGNRHSSSSSVLDTPLSLETVPLTDDDSLDADRLVPPQESRTSASLRDSTWSEPTLRGRDSDIPPMPPSYYEKFLHLPSEDSLAQPPTHAHPNSHSHARPHHHRPSYEASRGRLYDHHDPLHHSPFRQNKNHDSPQHHHSCPHRHHRPPFEIQQHHQPHQNTPPTVFFPLSNDARKPGSRQAKPSFDGRTPPPVPPPHLPPPGAFPDFKPKSVRFWLVIISNFLAVFLVALDRTIIATAIPRITDDFQSLGDIGWYGSAYMLTTAASQLLFGRIYKFYSIKWTFLVSIIVFEIGSVVCAIAPTSPALITGRAVAGFGSAGIFSGSMMSMIPLVPLHRRPMFQSAFGMVFGFASVIGPLVGGAFTGKVSWRWCFWINLPVGGVSLLCLIFFLPPAKAPGLAPLSAKPLSVYGHIRRLDPLGTLFFLPAITTFLLALQWGGAKYPWSDMRVVGMFLTAAILTIFFTAVQIMMPQTATLPGRVLRQRSVLAGSLFSLFLAGAMMMAIYYVPLWFQSVLQADPVKSGIYTIPLVVSIVVSSILSGIATQKMGYYVPSMLVCPVLMAIGEGLLSTFHPGISSARWIAYQFLTGFGLGFGMQTVNLAVQTVLPKEDVSTGIAISFFSQQLGAAIFVSVGQTLLTNLLAGRLRDIDGVDPHAISSEGVSELVKNVHPDDVPLVIDAYNFACTRIFLAGTGLCGLTFVCALFMQWKTIKKKPPAPASQPLIPEAEGPLEGPSSPKRKRMT